MREILFRGKRIDNGEWVEGYFAKYQPCASEDKIIYGIVPEYASSLYLIEIDPSTRGQYTGLPDKNGIKIFEGDILHCTTEDSDYNYITKVWAYGNTLCVDVVGCDYDYTAINFADDIWGDTDYEIEVIGNIHDNTELLKGEENYV